MKRPTCVKTLAFLAVLSALTATAWAQTSDATLTLSGTVSAKTEITVVAAARASNLDLVNGETGTEIATVTEISNIRTGYTVTLESGNEGLLIGEDDDNSEAVPYTLEYDGVAGSISLSDGPVVITDSSEKTPLSGVDKTLSISITGGNWNADTYRDVLTFEISAP